MAALRTGLVLCAMLAILRADVVRAQGSNLPLPPILSGYHGAAPYKTSAGGIVDPTLHNYVDGKPFVSSRGTWYNIVQWAARTNNCVNYPKSVACMACAQNLPPFTYKSHVVPIGRPDDVQACAAVANEFFGTPEKGATCGMCLRVYLPQHYKSCANHASDAFCAGSGSHPYIKYLSASWAWSAKIRYDPHMHLYYYEGIIIEWFDREQSLPYEITMPTQNVDTSTCAATKCPCSMPVEDHMVRRRFGDWPIKYRAIPCPVGDRKIMFQFLDFSKPVPLANGICNNQLNDPCGGTGIAFGGKPLGFLKFMITQQRIPISAVSMTINGQWQSFKRSGDGFWQPTSYDTNNPQDPHTPVHVQVFCTNGAKPLYATVTPAKMLCSYQNPGCIGYKTNIQC